MSETNTPGGIRGAILRIVVEGGTAKPEHIEELAKIDKEWKDAGLQEGDWGTHVNGKLVRVGSAEHQEEVKRMLNQYHPIK